MRKVGGYIGVPSQMVALLLLGLYAISFAHVFVVDHEGAHCEENCPFCVLVHVAQYVAPMLAILVVAAVVTALSPLSKPSFLLPFIAGPVAARAPPSC